ncbi:MAG: NAD-dependent epimerase/dehydratase family protein [Bacteroidales bacterium]|jgi:nucleoside-diphosphate-sugar epimerase|nr:NAD-dependent epimerase/dehydratase family protein [Bacteroidales bacterium]
MILVTGGTGLVGSHLLYHLAKRGDSVRAIYRAGSKINDVKRIFSFYDTHSLSFFENIEWVEADLADYFALEEVLKGITQVYHAAAMVSFNPHESKMMLKTNTEGTANLMNACLVNSIEKVCYVSSISSLGKQASGGIIDELVEWQANNHRSAYAHSKFRAEMEVWRAAEEGVKIVIVNPSVIIGPVDWKRSSGKLFYSVKKGMPFYTEGATGFVDVRDVVNALVLLMESDAENERFILNSENLSFKTFYTLMAEELNRMKPFIRTSHLMTEIGWRLNLVLCFIARRSPAITSDTARTAQTVSSYSAKKFSQKFNYSFIPVKKSVQNAARWFKLLEFL